MLLGSWGAARLQAGVAWLSGRAFPRSPLSIFTAAVLATIPIAGGVPAAELNSHGVVQAVGSVQRVHVTVYKSTTLQVDRPFSSAVVGSTDIADVLPMTDRTVYVQGKKVGTTNISIFDQSMHLLTVLDLEVTPDTDNLQSKICASTGSRSIRVSSSQGQIVLSGTAQDAVAADRAVSVAKSLVPDGKGIVNAMRVAPSQQVMLRVRFLEASRDAGRELGVNWFVRNKTGTTAVRTGLGDVTTTTQNGISVATITGTLLSGNAPFGAALAGLVNNGANGTNIDVLISALETKGLIRRLAEPDLVALSGDTAAFLAGGEFPVPVAQPSANGASTVTIEFKPFGVQLTFQPTVLADGLINLRLAPSVSELDFANPVQITGSVIPSLIKREARTTVELRDGQSFAIAGLLQAENRRNLSQLPWIGSVPVLGALFRSSQYQKHETDLVVIVTPHLVAPAAPGQHVASPLDNHIPTNDLDFFLLGQMEERKIFRDYIAKGGDVHGPYGHIIAGAPTLVATPITEAPLSARD